MCYVFNAGTDSNLARVSISFFVLQNFDLFGSHLKLWGCFFIPYGDKHEN